MTTQRRLLQLGLLTVLFVGMLTTASSAIEPDPCDRAASEFGCYKKEGGAIVVGRSDRVPAAAAAKSTGNTRRKFISAMGAAFCADANVNVTSGRGVSPEVGALCRDLILPPNDLGRGNVLRAFRELGLYRGEIRTAPKKWTLVNLETFFWCGTEDGRSCAELGEGERTVTLLGRPVRIRPKIVGYSWNFGDGTTAEVTGRAAHTYAHAGNRTVTLTLTWTADYAVGTAAFQPIDDTTTTTSAPRLLPVREAQTVIVGG